MYISKGISHQCQVRGKEIGNRQMDRQMNRPNDNSDIFKK